ncbi:MAG: Molybdopterin synthase catalytic subunit MoaE [uncultured Sphingomonadaceae bacterium]|uniref:Molybdopterin synthase catalytic subunit n=1 Tax=uncultured Sphingomonadaceae bacterium TaxID=169976 RepID=A0A6J4TIM7_9SPHN|nr:MAG: Molybdopterin synthase catalytic subunit MoaE [uncultured Sphingomonadaceae bacterium]
MIRVQEEPFDASAELARLAERAPSAGAVAAFIGLVRPASGEDAVTRLELQHHPRFTLQTVEAIGEDGRRRFGLQAMTIIHRYGILDPGEAIVFVAAAAEHRRAAFDAVDYLMDRLKTEAAFWKREHGSAGARWIEARADDHADRRRWGDGRGD